MIGEARPGALFLLGLLGPLLQNEVFHIHTLCKNMLRSGKVREEDGLLLFVLHFYNSILIREEILHQNIVGQTKT